MEGDLTLKRTGMTRLCALCHWDELLFMPQVH